MFPKCGVVVTDNIDGYYDMDCVASMHCYSTYMIPHAVKSVNIFRPRNTNMMFQQQLQV
jgi:hypothetical protein